MLKAYIMYVTLAISLICFNSVAVNASVAYDNQYNQRGSDPYNIELIAQEGDCVNSNIEIKQRAPGEGDLIRIDFTNKEMQAAISDADYANEKYFDEKNCYLKYKIVVDDQSQLTNAGFSAAGSFVITKYGFLLSQVRHEFPDQYFSVNDSAIYEGHEFSDYPYSDSFDNQMIDIKQHLDNSQCGGEFTIETHLRTFVAITHFDQGPNLIDFDQAQGVYDLWNLHVDPCNISED